MWNTIRKVLSKITPAVDDRPKCPNCQNTTFNMGPAGGGSQNVQCTKCLKYYNYMGLFGFQDIGDRSEIFGTKQNQPV